MKLQKALKTYGAGTMTASALATLLAIFLSLAACSKAEQKTTESHLASSEKAAAEAEAAEEEFAKVKMAKAASRERKVASVSRKASRTEQAYLVQVGTFRLEENANKIEAKLKSVGLPAFQKKIEHEGETFYAVRIEPTPTRSEAEKFVSSVKAATGESSLILSVGR